MNIADNVDDLMAYKYYRILDEGVENGLHLLNLGGRLAPKMRLKTAWVSLQRDILKERLKDPDFVAELEDRQKRAIIKADAYLKNKAAKLKAIELWEKKQEETKAEPMGFYDFVGLFRRVLGFQGDAKTISLREHLNYVKQLKQAQKDGGEEDNA